MSNAELLWQGEFGDAYTDRNAVLPDRSEFWKFLKVYPVKSVLEVGCNVGWNLGAIQNIGKYKTWGIDVNRHALEKLHERFPSMNAMWGRANDIPFHKEVFDLVFTVGVLIHQSREGAQDIMKEMYRVSRRFILFGEYFAEKETMLMYRGEKDALYKRDYGVMFQVLFPSVKLLERGELGKDKGFDNVTYWLFEK